MLYTDEDVAQAENVYVDCAIAEDCYEWPDGPSTMRAILDAVAPAIAARVLREFAQQVDDDCPHELDSHAEGTCEVCDYAFAMAATATDRADEIEGKS